MNRMTARTRIKICGMTRRQDAAAAVAAGVDALGFIFVEKSPRYISPESAFSLIRELPPFVDAVGVFLNEDPAVVEEIIQYCGLTMVQLHGAEPPVYCAEITARVIKAFRISPEFSHETLTPYADRVKGFLFDTYDPELAGGTGRILDWRRMEGIITPGPVILAGGLNPDNIGEAISRLRPYAVDMNSGIETAPGCKDAKRLTELVNAVREIDARLGVDDRAGISSV